MTTTNAATTVATTPVLRPPRHAIGAIAWVRENLFSSVSNSVLTLAGLWLIYKLLAGALDWAFVTAVWNGPDGRYVSGWRVWELVTEPWVTKNSAPCRVDGTGACWPFVANKFPQFIYGRYPFDQRWRVDLVLLMLVAGLVALMVPRIPAKRWSAGFLFLVFPVLAFWLLSGGDLVGLPVVKSEFWGGLLVTLVVALVGLTGAFPVGVLLALGRRSKMPLVRWASVGFIEFVRGVPLITILFMSSVMLPLFLPDGISFDKLLRALIGVMMFQGAYMAETIRGGLQAIPRGQSEAADALGLSYPQKIGLIVLPQALKLVIPGIVNSFVGLFKDTSLVLIIGLFDLLGIVQLNSNADPNWSSPTTNLTGYVFAALIFWIFCFGISRYSQMVERRLAAGEHK